jgi:phytoene synthase
MEDVPRMTASSRLSFAAQEVRRFDRDRFVTALLAPVERREALFGLYAFNQEIARVRELVTEPMLGQIRLQWWRDTLDQLFRGVAVAHPVAEALAEAVNRHDLSRSPFDRLIDSRMADLEDAPPETLAALEDYAEGTSSTINALVMEVLDVHDEPSFRASRHLGIAWALTGLLRAVPFHASARRLYLPADLMAEHGVEPEQVLSGQASPGLSKLAEALAQRAREHLARARSYKEDLPRTALPGLYTALLADRYLDRLGKAGFNPLNTGWSEARPRPALLALNAWLGRY